MIRKISLAKKIASYSALAGSLLAVNNSEAQIVHHNVTPNDTLPNGTLNPGKASGSYYLDLNGDGIADFQFSVLEASTYKSGIPYFYFFAYIQGLHTNDQFAGFPATTYFSGKIYPADIFSKGQPVTASFWKAGNGGDLYENYETFFSGKGGHFGKWKNQLDQYAGLRIMNTGTGDVNYGWVRLSVPLTKSFQGMTIIKDYAFQTMPDTLILAGDTGVVNSIQPVGDKTLKLFVNNRVLNIQFSDPAFLKGNLIIYNEAGKSILKQTVSSEDFSLSLQSLPAGIYFVKLENNSNFISRKIFVE